MTGLVSLITDKVACMYKFKNGELALIKADSKSLNGKIVKVKGATVEALDFAGTKNISYIVEKVDLTEWSDTLYYWDCFRLPEYCLEKLEKNYADN